MRHSSMLLMLSMASAMSPGFSERIMTATPPRPRNHPKGPQPKREIVPNEAMKAAQARREARTAKKSAHIAKSKASNYHSK